MTTWYKISRAATELDRPRYLTNTEKKKILDSIPEIKIADNDGRKLLKKRFNDWLIPYLDNNQLAPSKINKFITCMIKLFYKSLVQPGTNVGIDAGAAFTGFTQNTLSSFHSSGTEKSSKVVSNVTTIKNYISATENPISPFMVIYFNNPYVDPKEIFSLRSRLVQTNLHEIIKDFQIFEYSKLNKGYWNLYIAPLILNKSIEKINEEYKKLNIMRLFLDVNYIYQHKITIEVIVKKINETVNEKVKSKYKLGNLINLIFSSTSDGVVDIYPNIKKIEEEFPVKMEDKIDRNVYYNIVINSFYLFFKERFKMIMIKGIEGVESIFPLSISIWSSFSKILKYNGQNLYDIDEKINGINIFICYLDNNFMKINGITIERIKMLFELTNIKIININEKYLIVDVFPNYKEKLIIKNNKKEFKEKYINSLSEKNKKDIGYLLIKDKKEFKSLLPLDISSDINYDEKIIKKEYDFNDPSEINNILLIKFNDSINKYFSQLDNFQIYQNSENLSKIIKNYGFKYLEIKELILVEEFLPIDRINYLTNSLPSDEENKNIKLFEKKSLKEKIKILQKIYYARINGINFKKIIYSEDIDSSRSYCNNLHEMFAIFGIESTRAILIKLIDDLLKESGSAVDYAHIALTAEIITNTGKPLGANYTGIKANLTSQDALALATVERAYEAITEKALFGVTEKVGNFADAVMTGSLTTFGTGSTNIGLGDKKYYKNNLNIENEIDLGICIKISESVVEEVNENTPPLINPDESQPDKIISEKVRSYKAPILTKNEIEERNRFIEEINKLTIEFDDCQGKEEEKVEKKEKITTKGLIKFDRKPIMEFNYDENNIPEFIKLIEEEEISAMEEKSEIINDFLSDFNKLIIDNITILNKLKNIIK